MYFPLKGTKTPWKTADSRSGTGNVQDEHTVVPENKETVKENWMMSKGAEWGSISSVVSDSL